MKQAAKAALQALITYATSKEATKLERSLLAGAGTALVLAVKGALGW